MALTAPLVLCPRAEANVAPIRRPIAFEETGGGAEAAYPFRVRLPRFTALLAPHEATLLHSGADETETILLRFHGANAAARAIGKDRLPGRVHVFRGDDPGAWRTGLSIYNRVVVDEIYPGVALEWYERQGLLEFDLVVAPGADPGRIEFSFAGQRRPTLLASGDIVLDSCAGRELTLHRPRVFQQDAYGARHEVGARFVGKTRGRFQFRVDAFDRNRELRIDPVLEFSTFLGGDTYDYVKSMAVDATGVYLTGTTASANFPTAAAIQPAVLGRDAFVTKVSPDGSTLIYSTYLGGSTNDQGWGIAVDATGSAYVAGITDSPDFPTASPFQNRKAGALDAFVVKLAPDGSALVYSTYLGGSRSEGAFNNIDLAIDQNGSAYIVGGTESDDFPMVNALFPTASGGGDAFLVKFDPSGTAVSYSTYFGGGQFDFANKVAVDSLGAAWVVGEVRSPDFPTVRALQLIYGGHSADAFVLKMDPTGSALVFSTYLGGSSYDYGKAVTIDSAGNGYVVGYTNSPDFPVAAAAQATLGGGIDAFITKISADGATLLYSTYLGSSDSERAFDVAVDASGRATVVGDTTSPGFPLVDPLQAVYGGSGDAMVARLDPSGASFEFATWFGGSGYDSAGTIAIDANDAAWIAGETSSSDFPTLHPLQSVYGGFEDAFVFKLCNALTLPVIDPVYAVRNLVDVELGWNRLSASGYGVWRTSDKREIPNARAPGNPPIVTTVAGCAPAVANACTDFGAVAGPPNELFHYQVRALCGNDEGP